MNILISFFICVVAFSAPVQAQDIAPTSSDLVRDAWKASNDNDMEALNRVYDQTISLYGPDAKLLAAELTSFPVRDQVDRYAMMNDVATVTFIKAEALMRQGSNEESKALFEQVIFQYPWSKSWDPSRGSFWSVKEKSEDSIKVMMGESTVVAARPIKAHKTLPHLEFPGKEQIIDYAKYGNFLNVGTKDYHYQITDQEGLVAASGEAIYPNLSDIYRDPSYKQAMREGRLEGSPWDFVNTDDLEAAIYKWATASEPWGIRLFYMGTIFEKAKMYHEAINVYRAIVVFFPNTIAWTYWQTPWYPGQAAIAKIQHITRMHPELNLQLKGAKIQIKNSFDNDPNNDVTITNPGEMVRLTSEEMAIFERESGIPKAVLENPVKTLGQGKVQLVKYLNGHWQLLVDQKPFIIKGMTYAPTKVGQSPDKGTLGNWMVEDLNHNGKIDGPYDAWMDENNNGVQDENEEAVGDFVLMKQMGVNTLRIYEHPDRPISKSLLRKMHEEQGFMVLMGNLLGKYAVGSGASWSEGTDYENETHQKNMMDSVRAMVEEYKDEPYVLMWLLGNENNYGVASNADKKPDAYFKFVNDVARMIKEIDPNHPVAVCNGDALYVDKFAQHAPDVDAYAANVYRGDYGFGSFWQQISEAADRPTFISEYGAPAYEGATLTYEEAQEAQASYHKGNWLDILHNSAGFEDGVGNSIGGVAFEWLDEWWKNYEPAKHDIKADVVGPFPGGYYYEEWFGILGQGQGKNSPYLREGRKVYYTYKELWNH